MKFLNTILLSAVLMIFTFTPESLPQVNDKNVNERTLTFTDEEDGKEVHYEVKFKDGEIVSIYRNNIKITEEELDDYSDKVYDVLQDLLKEEQEAYTFNFDFDELRESLKNMHENLKAEQFKFKFDNEEFRKQMEKLKEEFKDIDKMVIQIDKDKLKENIDRLKIHKFDFDFDYDFDFDDSELNPEKLQEEMDKLNEKMEDLNKEIDELDKEMKILNKFIIEVKQELIEDGYIKENESVKLELSDEEMEINGEKVPSSVHKKYLDIYKKHYKETPESKIKFHFE